MILMSILKAVAGAVYGLFKLQKVKKNSIVFLSRQHDRMSLDYNMVIAELQVRDVPIHIDAVLCRLKKTPGGMIRFAFAQLKSMYYLSRAQVCILDSYWPVVSMLKHREELVVIQMWHAMGKIKKSGHQTLDKPYGRDRKVADAMNMHRGYDVVIAGGPSFNPFYCEAFGVTEDKLFNIGLPRGDQLDRIKPRARSILAKYRPEYKGKKVIFYAPTFRSDKELDCRVLCEAFAGEEYALVVKPHPNQKLMDGIQVDICRELSSMTMLAACDYLITDYSAISVEAASVGTKTLFYLFDYEEYISCNGLNVDPAKEIPECTFFTAEEIVNTITNASYDQAAWDRFTGRYLPRERGCATEKIADLIIDCMERGKYEGIRRNLAEEAEADVPVGHADPVR